MFGETLLDYLGDLSPPLLPKHPFLEREVMRYQTELNGKMERWRFEDAVLLVSMTRDGPGASWHRECIARIRKANHTFPTAS